ncbi:MAG: nucleoside triphosphate pyrophosphohydrolase [Verrucomicrobiota bacterium]
MNSINKLRDIVAKLRSPEGCPWDIEQTHQSIRMLMLEECYETIEAIDEQNDDLLREELGDVLLHIVFHAQIAEEREVFSLDDVAQSINEKLIRRHPHVFGEDQCADAAEVLQKWDELKKQEKPERESLLDGVPPILPALMQAREYQKKAAKAGFDWDDPQGVLHKTREELDELEEALTSDNSDHAHIREEIGDLIFCLVNLSRHLEVDAEDACRHTNKKFRARFTYVEQKLNEQGKNVGTASLAEMEALWQEAKTAVGI